LRLVRPFWYVRQRATRFHLRLAFRFNERKDGEAR